MKTGKAGSGMCRAGGADVGEGSGHVESENGAGAVQSRLEDGTGKLENHGPEG